MTSCPSCVHIFFKTGKTTGSSVGKISGKLLTLSSTVDKARKQPNAAKLFSSSSLSLSGSDAYMNTTNEYSALSL